MVPTHIGRVSARESLRRHHCTVEYSRTDQDGYLFHGCPRRRHRVRAATASVEILDALEQGTSATRFVYRAQLVSSNAPYHGEYVLFVKEHAGKIVEIHERTDTLNISHTLGLVRPVNPSE